MTQARKDETTRRGLPLSDGVAVGQVCLFRDCPLETDADPALDTDRVPPEVDRFGRAVRDAARRVGSLRRQAEERMGLAEAGIFEAHLVLIEDAAWHEQVTAAIRSQRVRAEAAVNTVLGHHENRMRGFADPHLRDRATDVAEARRHVLAALGTCESLSLCAATGKACLRGRNRIVVAPELTPAMTLGMDSEHVLGFVTERGGVNSHAAIMARALGIPAVSGIAGLMAEATCGMEVAMDGATGDVVLHPSIEARARFDREAGHFWRRLDVEEPVAGFDVMANINLAGEVEHANRVKSDGIGLYRTEFEFMARGRLLDEDEQADLYARVVQAAEGRHVTFRLFDAGGDKILPFIEHPKESNPALGWRGARLLLDRMDILAPQARALARASRHGPVRVLYPMIVDRGQFERLRAAFDHAIRDLPPPNLLHGVMLEVPAACLQARDLLEAADFGSVGTNDLIQHLFVVDRNNERVAHDYDADRPVFWSLLTRIVQAAAATGKPLTVCGELAANPRYVLRLMQSGVRSVSVSSRMIKAVRRRAREVLGDASLLNAESAVGTAGGI